jgi:hypothetical protein
MLRFEIFGIFDQIFQTTNPVLEAIKYPKYDPGFDLFDLWAALSDGCKLLQALRSAIDQRCCSSITPQRNAPCGDRAC